MNVIQSLVNKVLNYPNNEIFDHLIQEIEDYVYNYGNSSVMGISQLKINKNKLKGDIFEFICWKLLKDGSIRNLKVKNVWLFNESPYTPKDAILPLELRESFEFKNKDYGIDIIIESESGEYSAVQCKYRKKPNKSKTPNGNFIKWQVTWKDLSTFYSLCERTGPPNIGWNKHIVMTTAESINRQGRKNPKDLSICIGTFRGLPKESWFKFVDDIGYRLIDQSIIINQIDQKERPNLDELRKKRIAALEIKKDNS